MSGKVWCGGNALSEAVLEVLRRDAVWIVGRRSKGNGEVAKYGVEECLGSISHIPPGLHS